jgi:hypothetical protein
MVELPEGYYLTWGGEFENQRRAMARLMFIVPISIAIIFVLLYMTFRAALPAVVVLLDVPFATVGGVFALYLTHTVLSVSAAVGFITLFGVAVMDGSARDLPSAHADHGHDAKDAIWRPCPSVSARCSRPSWRRWDFAGRVSHAIGSDTQSTFVIGGSSRRLTRSSCHALRARAPVVRWDAGHGEAG